MKIALTAIACAFGLATVGAAFAEPPALPPPPKPKSVCLNAGDIDHYSYPDDQTILFHMRGGKVRIWRNDLKRACPGLKFEQAIALEIRGGTICSNMQMIYVMHRWTPCMLGEFTPYVVPVSPPQGAPHTPPAPPPQQ
jgi:hypothetical protein